MIDATNSPYVVYLMVAGALFLPCLGYISYMEMRRMFRRLMKKG